MPIVDGYWQPNLSQKQVEIANCRKRYLLVSGPKKSGKTLGCCHRAMRHLWDTDRARAALFTRTKTVAKEGGVWNDIIDIVMPEWLGANMGMRLITPPKLDAQTRQAYFEVSNRHGTKSRMSLNSLDYDMDIESVARGKRWSLVWFNELSNFKNRRVFDITIDQLRCVHLGYDDHQWMGDTNPDDEGEENWIYKLWYQERIDENHQSPAFRNDLHLIEVMIHDNPFLSDRERENLIATFKYDPDLYDRYIRGIWTSSTRDSHFSDVFRPGFHIVGDTSSKNEEDWEVLLPESECDTLISGWDLGSINHSITLIEPARIDDTTVYKVLDERVHIGENIGLELVVREAMEMFKKWEDLIGRPIIWRHWSDKNAFDAYRPAAELYDYQLVYKFSEGKIGLLAAPKFHYSIPARINLTRRLFHTERLLISARCFRTISMVRSIKKGRRSSDAIDRTSPHKHPFDSMTYPLLAECPTDELVMPLEAKRGKLIMV